MEWNGNVFCKKAADIFKTGWI